MWPAPRAFTRGLGTSGGMHTLRAPRPGLTCHIINVTHPPSSGQLHPQRSFLLDPALASANPHKVTLSGARAIHPPIVDVQKADDGDNCSHQTLSSDHFEGQDACKFFPGPFCEHEESIRQLKCLKAVSGDLICRFQV